MLLTRIVADLVIVFARVQLPANRGVPDWKGAVHAFANTGYILAQPRPFLESKTCTAEVGVAQENGAEAPTVHVAILGQDGNVLDQWEGEMSEGDTAELDVLSYHLEWYGLSLSFEMVSTAANGGCVGSIPVIRTGQARVTLSLLMGGGRRGVLPTANCSPSSRGRLATPYRCNVCVGLPARIGRSAQGRNSGLDLVVSSCPSVVSRV